MAVQRRVYRFRILTATLSRSFTFRLVNVATGQQVPVHVVATDGGLMPKAQQVTSWRQAGAERYEVLVDFSQFEPACRRARSSSCATPATRNNQDFLHTGKVMEFRLSDEPVTDTRNNTIPATLVNSAVMSLTASAVPPDPPAGPAARRRHQRVQDQLHGRGDDVQDSGFTPARRQRRQPPSPGDVELWEIENRSGGWFHPLHIHLVDFKILSRTGGSGRVQPWEQGPKDVVYVGEGEIVRVLAKYDMVKAEHTITHPVTRQPYTYATGKAGATGGAAAAT